MNQWNWRDEKWRIGISLFSSIHRQAGHASIVCKQSAGHQLSPSLFAITSAHVRIAPKIFSTQTTDETLLSSIGYHSSLSQMAKKERLLYCVTRFFPQNFLPSKGIICLIRDLIICFPTLPESTVGLCHLWFKLWFLYHCSFPYLRLLWKYPKIRYSFINGERGRSQLKYYNGEWFSNEFRPSIMGNLWLLPVTLLWTLLSAPRGAFQVDQPWHHRTRQVMCRNAVNVTCSADVSVYIDMWIY